jgi:hypothetical protein
MPLDFSILTDKPVLLAQQAQAILDKEASITAL